MGGGVQEYDPYWAEPKEYTGLIDSYLDPSNLR